ncbi:MAG: sugar ABC transporter permease [Ardenticatenales bacterium]|nr:sugar ABC transporter permease [Ardenticatenales bacterium]
MTPQEQRQLRGMLLPYQVGLLILVLLPALLSFAVAFFFYDGLRPPFWSGTVNFLLVYTDELFDLSVLNSLALILIPVPLRVGGAFLLALLLRRGGSFLNLHRAAIFLPNLIPSTAYALAWLWIFNPLYGPLNLLLRAIGIDGPAWLVEPVWAKPSLALMSLWLVGEGFLVSLAALHELPSQIEEAAQIDGASRWQSFQHVLLPIVAPILLLLLLRDVVITFQETFINVMVMTQGGPYYATYTLPLFIYEQSFDLLAFGSAGAALWIMYLLTGLMVFAMLRIAKVWGVGLTEEELLL